MLKVEEEFVWLSAETVVESQVTYEVTKTIVESKARVVTLKYPEGKIGCVWPKIVTGEWYDVPIEDIQDE